MSTLKREPTPPTAEPHADAAHRGAVAAARSGSSAAGRQAEGHAGPFGPEIFAAIPGPLALLDETGVVVEVNAAWCRLTEGERTDDVGRPLWQRFTPAERTHVAALLERLALPGARNTDQPYVITGTQLRRADGRAIDVALRLGAAAQSAQPLIVAQLEPLPTDQSRAARKPGTGDRQIALTEIARSVAAGGDLHRIGSSIISAIARATGCPLVGLWRRANRSEAFVLVDGIGFTAGARRSMVLDGQPDGVAEHTLRSRGVVIIGGPSGTSARLPEVFVDHGVGSGAVVPVYGIAGADALVTVCAAHNRPLSAEDVRLLAIIGHLLSMTLQREGVADLIDAERRRTAEVATELAAVRRRHLLAMDTAELLAWRWTKPVAVVSERRLRPPPRLSLQACVDGGPQAVVDSASDDDVDAVAHQLNAALAAGDELDFQVCLHTTGGIMHVRLRGVIERDQHGDVLQICGVARALDLPARSVLPAVGGDTGIDDERLVTATHDLNNLLAAVLGTAEQLVEHGGNRQQLTAIVRAGRRARELVAGLRGGPEEAHPLASAYELADVVEQLRPLLPGLLGRDVRLVLELGRGARTLQPSREAFEHLLLNLVSNSADALDGGGTVVISTDTCIQLEASSHEPQAPPLGSWARLRVRDDGSGVPTAASHRLFEHGFTTKPGADHAGLGLACVREAVLAAGGVVSIDSAEGRGTTVEVYLPLAAREPVKLQPLRPTARPRGSTRASSAPVALVADDEPTVRTLLCELLSGLGFDVSAAADGTSALTLGRKLERLDVIISDLRMPQMDGLQLARQLRAVHQRAGIVLLSGGPSPTPLAEENLRIVPKPFDWQDLRAAVLSVTLAEPSSAAQLRASHPAASG